jgi:hypothetical protein
VNFAASETRKVIQVNVRGDNTVEPHEEFLVSLSNPTGGAKITTKTAVGSIRNDDANPLPSLAIASSETNKAEGNVGETTHKFTVTRKGDTTGRSTINYGVRGSGGSSANAADFGGTLPSGKLVFAENETSKTVSIKVSGDTVKEPDEGFTVRLSKAVGAKISNGSASGIIRNDDKAVASLPVSLPNPAPSPKPLPSPAPGSAPSLEPLPTPVPIQTVRPLVARADSITTQANRSVKIDVLSNDRLSQDFALSLATRPQKGTVQIKDNGTPNQPNDDFIIYTPQPGTSGKDSFSYQLKPSEGKGVTGKVKVNITPDSSTPATANSSGLYEAEAMSLTGYKVEAFADSGASGGKYISLRDTGVASGKASGVFQGEAGTYRVTVGYYDENDGQSNATVTVAGQSSSFTLDQDLPANSPKQASKAVKVTHSAIELNTGDRFELSGEKDAGEFMRFDYIRFTPVEQAAASSKAPATNVSRRTSVIGRTEENLLSTSRAEAVPRSTEMPLPSPTNNLPAADTDNDVLVGVDPTSAHPGRRERDVLIGGKGADTFQLGDERTVYYDDGQRNNPGLRDYALIKDFNLKEGDTIVLHGEAGDYQLRATPFVMHHKGLGIFHTKEGEGELVGVIENQRPGLNLTSNAFKFV